MKRDNRGHAYKNHLELTDEYLAGLPKPDRYEHHHDTKAPGLAACKSPTDGRIMFRYILFKESREALGITAKNNYMSLGKNISLEMARARCREMDEKVERIVSERSTKKVRKPAVDIAEELLKDRTPAEQASYDLLQSVLLDAYQQAAYGKGDERHSTGQNFEDQDMVRIIEATSADFAVGQAIKKMLEGRRMDNAEAKRAEFLGAIIYMAGAVVALDKEGG